MPAPEAWTRFIFDLDDTLYLERHYVRSGLRAVDAYVRRRFDVRGFFESAWAEFAAGRRGDLFDRALAELALPVSDRLIRRLVALYRRHRPRIRCAADARRFLERLPRGVRLGLISDGPAQAQRRKLAALGLERRFDAVVLTDLWGGEFHKPHPRAFELVERRLGGPPERFVYIGDNPCKDFQAPRQRGWATVRLRRPGGLYNNAACGEAAAADFTMASLEQWPCQTRAKTRTRLATLAVRT